MIKIYKIVLILILCLIVIRIGLQVKAHRWGLSTASEVSNFVEFVNDQLNEQSVCKLYSPWRAQWYIRYRLYPTVRFNNELASCLVIFQDQKLSDAIPKDFHILSRFNESSLIAIRNK